MEVTREEQCRRVILRTEAVIKGEDNLIANLANTAAVINQFFEEISWVGFYLGTSEGLVLGPFQGKPACKRIATGKGVCGTSACENRTILVPDVNLFPGHIACDGGTKSEIVVPMHSYGKVSAVLDIDSYIPERFSPLEAACLERVVAMLENGCRWPGISV